MDIKFELEHHKELDSTNEFLLKEIDSGNFHGRVISAHLQRKGKGRYGRSWESGQNKQNIALSIGFELNKNNAASIPYIPMLVAIETYNAIASLIREEERKYLSLKWPNDLIWKESKLMGILTQSREWKESFWLCVGLGINVDWRPKDIPATSLSELPLKEKDLLNKEKLIGSILKGIENNFKHWKDFSYIKKAWEERNNRIGKKILYGNSNKDYSKTATVIALDKSGGLLVEEENGEQKVLSVDDISVKLSES